MDFPFLETDGDDFVAQCYAFLLAGFETTSTTMTFALYELSLQPDVQHKLRAEINEVLAKHNQQMTYDGIQEMRYPDMVISGECFTHLICVPGLLQETPKLH
jgi:cytochrome P450 family 6